MIKNKYMPFSHKSSKSRINSPILHLPIDAYRKKGLFARKRNIQKASFSIRLPKNQYKQTRQAWPMILSRAKRRGVAQSVV